MSRKLLMIKCSLNSLHSPKSETNLHKFRMLQYSSMKKNKSWQGLCCKSRMTRNKPMSLIAKGFGLMRFHRMMPTILKDKSKRWITIFSMNTRMRQLKPSTRDAKSRVYSRSRNRWFGTKASTNSVWSKVEMRTAQLIKLIGRLQGFPEKLYLARSWDLKIHTLTSKC